MGALAELSPPGLTNRERARAESLLGAALLVALSAVAPLSVDMFLPSMPTMAVEFGASTATIQLGVTLFIVSFAGSQLVYGPASDRIGRRPVLLAGLMLFVIGGLVALAAPSVEVLILGRVLQGLGGGAGPTVAQAIVLDVYGRERAARVLSLMAIALPLAPAIAPIIGGVLHDTLGWHSVFVVLTLTGAALAVIYRASFPETNVLRGTGARGASALLANYRTVLSSRTYVAYALVMGFMFGGQLVFISSSSFVLIDEFGLGAGAFGLSFAFVALGIMAGAALSSRLIVRMRLDRVVLIGALVAYAASAVMVALAVAGIAHVATILLPMSVTAMGFGIARPSATAGALIPFPRVAGLASAVLGFSQMLIASSFNIAYGSLIPVSSRSLAVGVFLSVAVGLAVLLALRPRALVSGGEPEAATA
ncbi:MAG: multidrug effflux MFS transporter, partial [Chloroflexi bacterium]|nr:multidrug effflux MFS transporter [Chloroflexota bacterium]